VETTAERSKLWLLVLLAVLGAVIVNNVEHATKKHAHARTLRHAHEEGLCRAQEAYVSLRRGTLLVLCEMDPDLWGGLVWKVIETRHGERVLMDEGDMYECTCFAAERAYWERVIRRDGYVPVWDRPRWVKRLNWLIWP